MYYLVDTNVFLHVIDSNIYGVAEVCKRNGNDITITQTILKELDPGYYRENTDISSKEIYTAVSNLVTGAWGKKYKAAETGRDRWGREGIKENQEKILWMDAGCRLSEQISTKRNYHPGRYKEAGFQE